MFDTLCALPLSSELFSLSLHPSSTLLAVGLASGHVQTFKVPSSDPSQSPSPHPVPNSSSQSSTTSLLRRSSTSSNSGTSLISSLWRTRRHKGSCRSLAFSHDGVLLFSAGTDSLVKCADAETGRVTAKFLLPAVQSGNALDQPCLLHPLTPREFLLATDDGALYLYDTREPGKSDGETNASNIFSTTGDRPSQTWRPHGDHITSLTPLAPSTLSTSGFPRQFVTTGDTTVSLLDVRRGIIGTSAEGKEVLTSSCEVGGRVFSGDTGGSLTVWDKSVVKQWEDGVGKQKVQVARHILTPEGQEVELPVPQGEAVDVLCKMEGSIAGRVDGVGDMAVLGWDTGRIEVVGFGAKGRRGKVEASFMCDETDGVVALGFDAERRLVAGAGELVKIYEYRASAAVGSDEEDEETIEDQIEEMGDGDEEVTKLVKGKRTPDSDEDDEDEDEVEDSSEEEKKPKRKKKKRQKQGKGKNAHQTFSFAGLD